MRSKEHQKHQQNSCNKGKRLNKFLADSGLTSRRKAENLIKKGAVKVNSKITTDLATIVNPDDIVIYNGKRINQKPPVYILLNKPKNCLTTTYDPQNRKIVMDLIDQDTQNQNGKIFPVGRLDRNTSGALLITNDGYLANELMHPKKNVEKVYAVKLDQKLLLKDFNQIKEGIKVDKDFIKADRISYPNPSEKSQLYLTIHSGQNRIVRRMFKKLGYHVENLDRIVYAGLTKEKLKPGHWRYLSKKEIEFLENQVIK